MRDEANEDKRVIKTKKNIKSALTELLSVKNFDAITVKALCDKAQMSRITFYSHYSDKYELVEEMFSDLLNIVGEDYYRMQEENNQSGDVLQCYYNLLESVLNLYGSNTKFLRQMSQRRNPYLYYSFYNMTFNKVLALVENESHRMLPRVGARKFSAFMCNGLWAYIDECRNDNCNMSDIKSETKLILKGIIESDIFLRK